MSEYLKRDEVRRAALHYAGDALIAKLDELRPVEVPDWIPVTERLPELTEQIETDDYCVNYSKEVLIWSPMNMVPLFEIAIYTDDRGWTDPYFIRIKFQEMITHWMPLQQPEVKK